MIKKILIILIPILLIGCTTEYVCSDGSVVLSPDECQINNIEQDTTTNNQIVSSDRIERQEDPEPVEPPTQNEIDLELINLKCEDDGLMDNWVSYEGRVKNNDLTRTAEFVKINIDLFNGDEWVTFDQTYVRNGDIPAGRTESFEGSIIDVSEPWTRCEGFITYRS